MAIQAKRMGRNWPLIASDTQSPTEIGAALARDFIQAQWLRIHNGANSGAGTEMPADEMDHWCPLPRLRFRLPPWWEKHDVVINDDETLFAIYRSFDSQLTEIARSSDDPALNNSIIAASDHIHRMLNRDASRKS
jgi:hypothetical protein